MADKSDGSTSLREIDKLRKCLSNIFDFPERQLQAAFALVIELFHEQAARQQTLHETFDALKDTQSEKDVTLSSCCVQLDKLSNDYKFCITAHDEILRNINILADQLKELSGLCFGSTLYGNLDFCTELARTSHEKTSDDSCSERQQLSEMLTGPSNGVEGCSPVTCIRQDEVVLNEPNTFEPVSAAPVAPESILHIESARSTVNAKSIEYENSFSEKTFSTFQIDVGKPPDSVDEAAFSAKKYVSKAESARSAEAPIVCFPLKLSKRREAADKTISGEYCYDLASTESVSPVKTLSQNSDLVNHSMIATHNEESQKQLLTAKQDGEPKKEEIMSHVSDNLLKVQSTEHLLNLRQEDASLSLLNNQKQDDIQENVIQHILPNEHFDELSRIPKESKDNLTSAFLLKEKQIGLNVKGELQSAGKETQEYLPSFDLAARRTSLSLGSTKLSMDNALGYRVRRLEDFFSSFEEELQLMKAMSEKGKEIQKCYDAEVVPCTKEEMNLLSLRLESIENTLNKFLDASSISSTSDLTGQVLDERRSDFSDQQTNQKETKHHITENKQLYNDVVEVAYSIQLPSAIATDVSQSDSACIQSFPILTSQEQQTVDLVDWPNIQKMLASQEDYFKSEMHGLLIQICCLNDKIEEQLRRHVCVALPDGVSCRIDNLATALTAVESKANSKVDLTELCDLIGLLTGEGSVEDGDAQASFGVAVKSLSLFKKSFEGTIKLLQDKKADKSDLELSLRTLEGRLHKNMEDIIKKSCTSENSQLKVQREVDECRSMLDLFDSKIQFLATATNLDKSNAAVFSQIDAKIKESMHAVHASLEEAVSKKLEDIGVLENELERVTSLLAEKPDEKQLRDMFNDLELSLSARIGTGSTVQILLDNIRMEVMNKMTKSEVQELIKVMVGNAKKDIKAHEDDSLMIGTAPFRCLGCDQIFARGVHNKLATKKNHQALPSSGYLKRYNLLYLDPSSNNNTCESDINLPPMHSRLGFRRPKTSVFTSQQKRR